LSNGDLIYLAPLIYEGGWPQARGEYTTSTGGLPPPLRGTPLINAGGKSQLCSERYASAKWAALAPSAAAVMIWRRAFVRTSPTA